MVWNTTKHCLNAQLWVLWFLLPTVESNLQYIQHGSFIWDNDLSEQCLIFILHEQLQPFAEIDVIPKFFEETVDHIRVIW